MRLTTLFSATAIIAGLSLLALCVFQLVAQSDPLSPLFLVPLGFSLLLIIAGVFLCLRKKIGRVILSIALILIAIGFIAASIVMGMDTSAGYVLNKKGIVIAVLIDIVLSSPIILLLILLNSRFITRELLIK
jgi:hypothetical protein